MTSISTPIVVASSSRTLSRASTAQMLLYGAIVGWGILTGAAVYEHVALVPVWAANPPESLAMFQGSYPIASARFWMSIHPILLLTLTGALVAGWSDRVRRRQLGIVLAGYVVILALTAAWFVPELLAVTTHPDAAIAPAEWRARAHFWELASIARLGVIIVMEVLLLRALAGARSEPA